MMKKGFTLVETLVAIAVLLVAVTAAYSAAQSGLSGAVYSREEVVAFYLAQEGIEEIRNIRDENGLADRDWLTDIAAASEDACYFGKSCYTDAITNSLSSCSAPGECPAVRRDEENGFFGHDADWTETNFVREISLTSINTDEISVLVTVRWHKGTLEREFRVRENIMNWQ